MRSVSSDRIFGVIEELKPTYGYVRGDDQRQYFFLPSSVQSPYDFTDLTTTLRVCFLVQAHPRGLRAVGVTVTELSADESTDAQTDSQPTTR